MSIDAGTAGFVAIVLLAAAAVVLAIAAAILIRTLRGARGRIDMLQAELERLGDTVWDLRESEERARSLLDGQGDLIVRRDGRGAVTYANDAFCALAGNERETLVGSSFRFAVVESVSPERRESGVMRRDEAIRTAQGVRWIEWQEVVVRGPAYSQPERLSVGRDVTARREAEAAVASARDAAEAANRAKSRFLATVTHEIRTPMGGILGMADLLLHTRLAPDQVTYARAVKSSGEALLSLIDEILDLSKIEAGHLDLDEKPFALATLVEDVVELLAPRAHAKGLEIAAHVAADLPRETLGDAGRLKQVMLNLVGNAIKFTEIGGVMIRVCREGERIAFSVRDTGIGITADQLPLIFREFEQVDSTTSRRFGGTGLGLAISQRIVERMGGSIAVESQPNGGSTFRFAVAFAPSRTQTARQPAAPGLRVLVASPSPIVGPTLGAMLADFGAEAVLEPDPLRALERIGKERFDAVLADRAHGLDAAVEIAKHGLAQGRRVIGLVQPAERHEIGRLSAGGAAGYLIKPVRAASLLAQITGPVRAASAAPEDGEGGRPLAGLSVLLAEDNDINALVARVVLDRLGANVFWVRDGHEAVAAHAGRRFDAILMDMQMPGLDGPGASRAIRAAEGGRGSRTPIYALTANIRSEDRQACLVAGMDEFLIKPFSSDDLVALLAPAPPAARRA